MFDKSDCAEPKANNSLSSLSKAEVQDLLAAVFELAKAPNAIEAMKLEEAEEQLKRTNAGMDTESLLGC